jgi:hypothetical protein
VNRGHKSKATAVIAARYPEALVIPLGTMRVSRARPPNRTYPTIGNHELNLDPDATAYYDYFNGVGVDSGRAGHRGRGYYALDYGGWRILVANSHRNLDAQAAWMTRELAANPRCPGRFPASGGRSTMAEPMSCSTVTCTATSCSPS